ncbi:5'-nucleotidase [Roseivivax jejudonensis]|uniref:5'-deoxynucleotidase n=2 Tax=Roseivivax jejudonensis TaxID=1529041 RepID=A0A1X6YS82_9RHOB|nr:5'-nucleotidase [Roseivivax jejudonensis]
MAFLAEADRLKGVERATHALGGARAENSAEHSWHVALYALILSDHAEAPVDRDRVVRMLLLHDLVEIDAGDAPIFADGDAGALAESEAAAADRIFGLLPAAQATEMRALWEEFEAAETPEARFAKAIDRFQPPNQNLAADGGSWRSYGVTEDTFERRVAQVITRGAPSLIEWLWPKVRAVLNRL